MTTPYVTGTVSVTAGSAVVTGTDTGWDTSGLVAGVLGVDGLSVPALSIDSDTQITLAVGWPGPTASGKAYWITYDTTAGQQTVSLTQLVAEYVARLAKPFFAALSGLTPTDNTLPYFGAGAIGALTGLTSTGRDIIGAADKAAARTAIGAGTGGGDFTGPNGGVTANQLVGFADTTGKAGKGLTAAQARSASATPVGNFRNKIINPLFSINQRGVSGTVTLAAFAFGHDRMRAGAGGCTYAFSSNNGVTTFNITAGSLQQIVEANAFAGEAGTYYLSWSGTSQGRIGTGAYGTSGTVFTTTDANGAMLVEFNIGSLALPQLEKDYVAPFSGRAFPHELILCQRYFVSAPLPLRGIVNATGTLAARLGGPLPVKMRAVPSVSIAGGLYDGSGTANANGIQTNYSTADAVEADVVLTSTLTVGRMVLLFAPSTVRADAELS